MVNPPLSPARRNRDTGHVKPPQSNPGYRKKDSFAACEIEELSPGDSKRYQNKAKTEPSSGSQDTKTKETKLCLYCSSSAHLLEKCDRMGELTAKKRFDFVRSKGLCFGCLRFGHMKTACHKKATCVTCGGKHPTILHVHGKPSSDDKKTGTNERASSFCGHTGAGAESCAMAIIPVRVKLTNRPKSIVTYAFFDTGSSVSFCTQKLLRDLEGHGKRLQLTLNTMGEPYSMDTSAVHGLQVCDLEEATIVDLPCVYTKGQMPVNRNHIPQKGEVEKWPHLEDITIPHLSADIGLMIGINVPDAFSPLEIRTGPEGSPHATRTRLGWIVWNIVRDRDQCSEIPTVNRAEIAAINQAEDLKNLERLVRDSINYDFPERLSDNSKADSQEDKKFIQRCENSIGLIDGHYSMELPFRHADVRMPNYASQGKERLVSLKTKMEKSDQFREDYVGFMNKIVSKGYAEKEPDEDLERDNGRVWYIPHHGIYQRKKPQKIHVVFDCTAHFRGVSLNGQLLQGPDLTNGLLGVLLRFREGKVAVMGDVEAMFYQVMVSRKDIDCLRFFWWPEGNTDQDPVPHRMLVHLFGAVSSPSCSNFALRRTVEDNSDQFGEAIVSSVRNNMYVDDYLAPADTESEATNLIQGATGICQKGGFRLTKWVSSSRTVLENVPETERSDEVKQIDLDCGDIPNERALGVYWFVEQDSLGYRIQVKDKPYTRRGILSITSSVYDLLGIASPFVLQAKLILQDLCKQTFNWDEEICGRDASKWKTRLLELPNLEKLAIPRCYKPQTFGKVTSRQLRTFCDASEQGYGSVSYLRLKDDNNNVTCSFVMGKSRVAPLKRQTIPRMELTSASIAVKLSNLIVKELGCPMGDQFFWTDSMSTLRYISNENTRFHTFVANRVAVIRDSTVPDQWRHIDSACNPADCASRGMELEKFLHHQLWFQGPAFLFKEQEEWPVTPQITRTLPESDIEVKRVSAAAVTESQSTTDY